MKTPEECTTIEEIRQAIDDLDRTIIDALGRRFGYVKAITRFKKSADDVRAVDRYNAVLATRRAWAEESDLSADVIEQMYRNLIAYFIEEEMRIVNQGADGGA